MSSIRKFLFGLLVAILFASHMQIMAGESPEKNKEKPEVKWHKAVSSKVTSSVANIEEYADIQWRRFSNKMGFNEPRYIANYSGYGNDEEIWVNGRLLENRPLAGPKDDDNWWDNLQATYQRWESDEISNAEMILTYGNKTRTVTTDSEGYYHAVFERDRTWPQTDVVTAQHHIDDRILTATHKVFVSRSSSEFMLISDIDDTVIHTEINSLLSSAQLTFLHNARTRKPLTGAGSLYRSLAKGTLSDPLNPVFYVSNSAWNMYDLLRDFIDLNDLPSGPLLLRDIGLSSDTSTHKIDTVRNLLNRFPGIPVVLVGDSGQHDAEIYATLAQENPGRVKAIYIRDVDPMENSEYDRDVDEIIETSREADVPFLRVSNSNQIARHAAEIGLLPNSDLDGIRADVKIDKQRDTVAEEARKAELQSDQKTD